MPDQGDKPLAVVDRRRAMRLAYLNGAIWALGNGLTNSTLVIFLAMQLKVPGIGLGISLILAAPQLAGLLRLAAPPIIGRLVQRKQFCIGAYMLSAIVLACLPMVAAPGRLASPAMSLAALVGMWCLYQLLEYLGTVALWSWLADLAPLRIRGRFLGRRERWMAAGQAVGMAAGGVLAWQCKHLIPGITQWASYAVPTCTGAGIMAIALLPLEEIPAAAFSRAARQGAALRDMLAPLADRRLLGLLLFGCWLSFFNGLFETPQNPFYTALGLGVWVVLWLKTGLRVGQMAVGPWVGRMTDRLGNRAVMIGSLLLLAQAPLFFFLASPQRPWWVAGAWVMSIAWIGLNIGQPNLMLKLAPRQTNTPYIAVWFSVTGLCYAVSTVLGGLLFDHYREVSFTLGRFVLDYYHLSFLLAWVFRSLCLLVLCLLVVEPGEGERRAGRWEGGKV